MAEGTNEEGVMVEDIKESFEKTFPPDQIIDIKIDYYTGGPRSMVLAPHLWVRMRRESFHEAVRHLATFGVIHNSVASGSDLGDEIEVLYHLSLFSEEESGQITVTMGVRVPKDDPRYESICDIVPAARVTEREKQEFLGVIIDNIPDQRKLFLAESKLPEGVYPWRWDETGVVAQGLITEIHEKYLAPGSREEREMAERKAEEAEREAEEARRKAEEEAREAEEEARREAEETEGEDEDGKDDEEADDTGEDREDEDYEEEESSDEDDDDDDDDEDEAEETDDDDEDTKDDDDENEDDDEEEAKDDDDEIGKGGD